MGERREDRAGRVLDPRTKLYLLLLSNLMLLFHVGLAVEAAMVALFLLPLAVAGRMRKFARLAATYAVLVAVDLWLVPVAEGPLASFVAMLGGTLRMMFPVLAAGAYAFGTTTVGEFVCALRRMHVSESVIVPCMVVIRFFPTIAEDYRQIRAAMALRGIAEGRAALLLHPAQSLEYVLMPLLMNANNVAQDLSVAALTKGIGLPGEHSSMTEIRMRPVDWAYMAACTLPIAAWVGGLV